MDINSALDYKAKYHHFVKTLLVLMGMMMLIFFKVYIDQKSELKLFSERLQNRDILLIPSSKVASLGKLNQISNENVKSEARYIINMLGNLSRDTALLNYEEISLKMPERIRSLFLRESLEKINYIKNNKIFETIKSFKMNFTQSGPFSYRITAFIKLNVMVDDLFSGVKSEVMEFDLIARSPTKKKKWFFEIATFKRLDLKSYEKLQGVK